VRYSATRAPCAKAASTVPQGFYRVDGVTNGWLGFPNGPAKGTYSMAAHIA